MISSQNKKRFVLIFLVVFLFTSSIGILNFQKVKAGPVTVIDLPRELSETKEVIVEVTQTMWRKIWDVASKRAAQMFFENLAYEAAFYIAAGATGRNELWENRTWEEFLNNTVGAAAIEFVDSALTSPEFGDFGFDICQPPGGIDFKLALGFELDNADRPKPRCDFQKTFEKWGNLTEKFKSNEGRLSLLKLNGQSLKQLGEDIGWGSGTVWATQAKLLGTFIDVKQTDLGVAQFMKEELEAEKDKAEKNKTKDRTDSDNPAPVRFAIEGSVKVPASVSGKKLEKLQEVNEKAADWQVEDQEANIASIFLNTLLSKTMNNLLYVLMNPEPPDLFQRSGGDNDNRNFYDPPPPSDPIDTIFKTLQLVGGTRGGGYKGEIITRMELDLEGENIFGEMNNGTIDPDFAEVLRRAQGGETLLLREGVQENLIDDSRWFGYIDVVSRDPKQPSVDNGFSYDSIKKLVKNRVVSVGWLFAAEVIKEKKGKIKGCSSQGCTLKDVMDQYDKSGTYKINGETYKNDYCGWRPISAEPYFIDINEAGECSTTTISEISGIEVQWIGTTGPPSIPGKCYKYMADSDDGIIDAIEWIPSYDQEDCESEEPMFDDLNGYYYHEWVPGGCMIIEEDESPLCHLVDPDTVLRAPEQQCGAQSYYSILESNESSSRQEDCADVQHCIQENDQGKCVGGYDYCLKEENIWRFGGEACSPQFSSCQTLVDDEGEEQSYLTNTLKGCPQEEVGCRDYVVEKEDVDNQYVWNNEADRLYFNGSIEECNSSEEGCNEFIEIKPGVNLISNGSFEINEDDDLIPDGWSTGGQEYSITEGLNNGAAIRNNHGVGNPAMGTVVTQNVIGISPNTTYTISAFAKQYDGANKARVVISLCDVAGICDYTSTAEAINLESDCLIGSDGSQNVDLQFDPGDDGYQRGHCYFTTNSNTRSAVIFLSTATSSFTDEIWFDNIQLEKGKAPPTSYKEYGSNSQEYFKEAPDYLNCQDYDLNSYNCAQEYHPCCDYVKYCSVEDAGCSAYQPVNGDPFVPAVLQNEDYCVAECNNYQTFSQAPSYFDQLEDMNTNSIDRNFIPDTAEDCSEPSCELFTNIDALGMGAESKEYYSFVRQCVKPEEADIELYYTWEGSDTSAFQLKTWKLLAATSTDTFNEPEEGEPPLGGFAPCTNIEIGGTFCLDGAGVRNNVDECNPDENLDCRTFYDAEAIPHNRLLSRTIPITEECVNLRRELSNQTYKIAPSMSQTCSASNVGCLTYKGNYSDNVRNIFIEDFESGTTLDWMAKGVDETPVIPTTHTIQMTSASEAIQYNGNSMKVWTDNELDEVIWISYNLTEAGVDIFSNKQYSLSFWAKAFADDNAGDANPVSKYTSNRDDVLISFDDNLSVINDEWLLYKYDIVDLQTDITGDVILTFKININNYNTTTYDGIYIDNIILKGFTNSFNKIKDSWETPKICLEKNYLGCQEYEDTNNNTFYLYQFTDLCPEENIGCTAMIDTQNSSMPWQQTFNAYCNDEGDDCDLGKYYYRSFDDVDEGNIASSTAIISPDQLVYLVQDDTHSCSEANKGCQEMSVINNEGNNQSMYLLNNPDYYIAHDLYGQNQNILCLGEYKNCVSFSNSEGSKLFKIHPRDLVCEYQADDLENNKLAGFYNSEGENCQGLLYNQDYEVFTSGISITEDWKPYGDYDNKYAALCPAEENQCTTFIDPLDNSDLQDEVYKRLALSLNYNHPSEWQQALWSPDENNGQISDFNTDNISYHSASNEDDYSGLHVNLINDSNLLIYRGPDYSQDAFFFNVESEETYRVSARVKLEGSDSVMTFLSCRGSKTAEGTAPDDIYFDNYFVAEDEYPGDNSIPYAFPSIKSSYITNDSKDWQYIYGLYEILPGAHYCNLTFYIKDSTDPAIDSKFTIADINLERLEGDYHYLDNDRIDNTTCTSPDLKGGCVLFNSLNESSLKWNCQASYDENRLAPGDSREPSNANSLLKVIRDKQCAEWLTCGAELKSIDATSGQQKDSCVSLISCDELSEDESGICAHPFLSGQDSEPLTLDYYQKVRGKAGWSDLDYSGYSIPGLYPLDSLIPTEAVINNITSTVLSHLVVRQNSDYQPFIYKLGIGVDNYLQDIYSQPNSGPNWGSNLTNGQGFVDKSCRLYPEKDSPFPWLADTDVITEFTHSDPANYPTTPYVDIKTKSTNFVNANICQTGSNPDSLSSIVDIEGDCECHYVKANYGGETLYFPYDYNITNIPSQISIDYGGGMGDNTLERRSITQYLGWKGFCLDQEKSLFINNTESLTKDQQNYRCLTWYPVDLLSGEIDSYAASQEAEVSYGKTSIYDKLCVVGEDYVTTEDRVYCGHWSDTGYCNIIVRIPAGTRVKIFNLTTDNEKILLGKNNGNDKTWLSIGDTFLHFEEEASDIVRGTQPLSIIYRDTSNIGDDTDTTDYYMESESNKYVGDDFNWVPSLDGYDIFDDLVAIFDTDEDFIEKYYYDERVNATGDTIIGTLESRPAIYFNDSGTDSGSECDDCGTAKDYAWRCDSVNYNNPMHQVRIDCDKSSTNCGGNKWRNAWRDCNPRSYNYYVNYNASRPMIYLCGRCGYNCNGSQSKGLVCLKSNSSNHYNYVLTTYNNASQSIDDCRDDIILALGYSSSVAENDCKYVACMENSGIPDIYSDHLCNSYIETNGSNGEIDAGCGQYINDIDLNIISSTLMDDEHVECITGSPYFWMYDELESCYEGSSCGGANPCSGCTPTEQTESFGNCLNFEDCESGNTCAKTCKTYITLDGAIYNSNNFYLNWLTPDAILNGGTVEEVCTPDGASNICPDVLSGYSDNYNSEEWIRYSQISIGRDPSATIWNNIYPPFSSNAISSPSSQDLRNIIIADSGGEADFNNYYSDLNASPAENLEKAKDRLENVLVKVPNDNFYEYDGDSGTWPHPIWTDPYWNRTEVKEPFIQSVVHDENTGFSDGDSGISINSTHGEHIIEKEGNLYAYLMFYSYTATGTAPIQEIVINWGGSDQLALAGPFKNRKHDCIRRCGTSYRDAFIEDIGPECANHSDCSEENDSCFALTWGDHEDACVEDNLIKEQDGYFSYSYIYTCDISSDYWREESECREYDSILEGGCCIYEPKVTIVDSWGYSKIGTLGNCANDKDCSVIIVPK